MMSSGCFPVFWMDRWRIGNVYLIYCALKKLFNWSSLGNDPRIRARTELIAWRVSFILPVWKWGSLIIAKGVRLAWAPKRRERRRFKCIPTRYWMLFSIVKCLFFISNGISGLLKLFHFCRFSSPFDPFTAILMHEKIANQTYKASTHFSGRKTSSSLLLKRYIFCHFFLGHFLWPETGTFGEYFLPLITHPDIALSMPMQGGLFLAWRSYIGERAVSYTHLTLPTIYSV